jgi:hypothetical protein
MKVKQQLKKPEKAYVGVMIPASLKAQMQEIARREKRSLNAQTEIFLARGVQHLEEEEVPA